MIIRNVSEFYVLNFIQKSKGIAFNWFQLEWFGKKWTMGCFHNNPRATRHHYYLRGKLVLLEELTRCLFDFSGIVHRGTISMDELRINHVLLWFNYLKQKLDTGIIIIEKGREIMKEILFRRTTMIMIISMKKRKWNLKWSILIIKMYR